ncbi:alpha/beta hydrolase [Engelhardtia mirabilis]|uniref:Esterase n=1 Tax=Engelhardtia mirabilis TaxID=2528011 RepID=A0A518BMW0_9BACT|nr:esterase [Planctomycetes bacterium Pla133]QDV02648.1 esterase [Planctomycetes bacterium Pla86]
MLHDLHNNRGERLDASLHEPAGESRVLVLIGHGVTANKDREWAVTLAQALADAGCAALRFSFSGNGDSGGKFGDSCPTKEAGDLHSVIDAAEAAGHERVVYVGHSMGGAVGVIAASRDRRIGALVSLAGMVDTAEFARRKFGDQQPGDLMWDKPECPLSQTFLDDMAAVGTVAPLAADIRVPWLLVHGDADTVVPPQESTDIAARAGGPVELRMLSGVDHVFTGAAAAMAREVVSWLESSPWSHTGS